MSQSIGRIPSDHPSIETVAAYTSGLLSPTERDALKDHFSECASCTETVLDLAGDQPAASLAIAAAWEQLREELFALVPATHAVFYAPGIELEPDDAHRLAGAVDWLAVRLRANRAEPGTHSARSSPASRYYLAWGDFLENCGAPIRIESEDLENLCVAAETFLEASMERRASAHRIANRIRRASTVLSDDLDYLFQESDLELRDVLKKLSPFRCTVPRAH